MVAVTHSKLSRQAGQLEDTLSVLNRLTTEAGTLLDVLGSQLHDLTTMTAPIRSRASALTVAQQNITAIKGNVDELLEHLDTSRRVRICSPLIIHTHLKQAHFHWVFSPIISVGIMPSPS